MIPARIVFSIMGIVIFILIVFLIPVTLNGEEVDCYDERNNKMIDQKCVIENGFDTIEEGEAYNFKVGIIILIIIVAMGFGLDWFLEVTRI